MKNLIIEGPTGCGKTYYALHRAIDHGKTAYIAPCRQLAYEIFLDYGKTTLDTLSTGEVKIKGNRHFFGVFESLQKKDLSKYDVLIIDEAHFLCDYDRGGHLYSLITEAQKLKKDIFLLTATRNFRKIKNFEIISLKPRKPPPKRVKVDFEDFEQNISDGLSSIEFVKYKGDAEMRAEHVHRLFPHVITAALTADTPPMERLHIQMEFRSGRIGYVACTNVLAQGINMPCTNMLIQQNMYDDPEIIFQKLGRLGRLGWCLLDEVYFCFSSQKGKVKKNKKIKKITREKLKDHELLIDPEYQYNEHEGIACRFGYRNEVTNTFVPVSRKKDMTKYDKKVLPEWNFNKYSKNFIFDTLKKGIVKPDFKEVFEKTLSNILEEEKKIKNYIINFDKQA